MTNIVKKGTYVPITNIYPWFAAFHASIPRPALPRSGTRKWSALQ